MSGGGITVGRFGLEDAAVLTQRFARHVPQPPQSFFREAGGAMAAMIGATCRVGLLHLKKDGEKLIKEKLEVNTSELQIAMDVTAMNVTANGWHMDVTWMSQRLGFTPNGCHSKRMSQQTGVRAMYVTAVAATTISSHSNEMSQP